MVPAPCNALGFPIASHVAIQIDQLNDTVSKTNAIAPGRVRPAVL
ncbi:hypothetical protein [Sphingomonas sp. PB1R3]